MALDAKKPRTIVEPFEKEVYEALLKLDKNAEFLDVEVYYHRKHKFEGSDVQTDFEIHFENGGRHYILLLETKHHTDIGGSLMGDLEKFVHRVKKIEQECKSFEELDPVPKYELFPMLIFWIESGEEIPGGVFNEANGHRISIYTRILIDQFSQAMDDLSPGIAFLDFLHSYAKLDISFQPEIISLKGLMSQNFSSPTYTFSMTADDLIRISYVNRANINKKELNEAYQRAIKEKRLDEIADFIEEQSKKSQIEVFPNNVVANANGLTFVPDENNPFLGTISFPNKYGVLTVIDGQHRLYSFTKLKDKELRKKYRFNVTSYSAISNADQAEVFYTINDKQEGINPDLIMFIQAQLKEKTIGYAAKLLLDVDEEDTLFTKPLKKGFEERERGAWLKLSTLTFVMVEEGLIDYEKSSGGLLQKHKDDLETPTRILKAYLNVIKEHFTTSWNEGKKGLAQSNQGLGIFLIILKKIIETKTKSKDDLDDIDEDVFREYFEAINSQTLQPMKLAHMELRDIRNKTDRRNAANKLWDKIR